MKKKLLIQIDPDPQPSLFDRIVAYDGGADEVLSYGGVTLEQVRDLIHGCIFTRGPKELQNTAVFIGGRDVETGSALLDEARKHLLPQYGLTVSLMLDANGANTTAAAAVSCVALHQTLPGISAGVLGAGPVGARIALLLARQGAVVQLVDVQASRAESVRQKLRERLPNASVHTATELTAEMIGGLQILIAAGPTGKELIKQSEWITEKDLRVVIDLNAVPPAGVEGLAPTDLGEERHGKRCYGPLGVGALKMKIHRSAIARLFSRSDQVLDVEELFGLAAGFP